MRSSSALSKALGVLAGISCTAAFAIESSLTLPLETNAAVTINFDHMPAQGDPSDYLQVYVGSREECCDGKLPVAGKYSATEHAVTFDPAFDFQADQTYTVRTLVTPPQNNSVPATYTEFVIPQNTAPEKPGIVAIYPSGEFIPENTLRFYLHFSTPMKPHVSSRFIKLLDANGTPDDSAFMTFKQELWSEDRKRLTMLIDPGRIKRGVTQNLTLGPALVESQDYSIVIEKGWQSATGTLTTPRFEKSFTVSSGLRSLPDTKHWQIQPIRGRTHDPLLIEFDRPFDHQSAQHSITVHDEHGQLIEGEVSVLNNEKTWRFSPYQRWKNRQIKIYVDPRLEDVAGNNFIDLLDHSFNKTAEYTGRKTIVLEHTPTSS